jgi:LPS export ABC transporter protein LptC
MKHKEALGLVIILAVLMGLAAGLYRAAKPPQPARSYKPVLPEGVMAALEGNSRITSTQSGRMEWTMLNQGLAYYNSSGKVLVKSPHSWIPVKDGGTVEVRGVAGEYFKDSEDIRLQDGVSVEMEKAGRKQWVIAGDTASFRRGEDAFYIGGMDAELWQASGDTVRIKARNGRYDTNERTMTARNNVSCVFQNGMTLLTEEIVYQMDDNLAVTDKPVAINGQGFRLNGLGLRADLSSKKIVVPQKVRLRMEKGMKGIK